MKRIAISIILLLMLTLTTVLCVNAGGIDISVYKDFPQKSSWKYEGLNYCVQNGLINGTSKNTVSPDNKTTRGEFVTILWRYNGSPNRV